ncbi:MAG TPA: TolC family protein [Alphaproteobacteria bacterium]|nr:TolC family protein [Alphaproteobacteria bacterium]
MKSPSITRRPVRSAALAALTAVLLAGCAVTPQPFAEAEHAARAGADRAKLFAAQEPISGPVSLGEAMARALKYNYDHRLSMMEGALQQRQLDLSRFDLLPRLAANAGYTQRNNDNLTVSRNTGSGLVSADPSLSSERQRLTADLTLSWNILDFGVSYYAAHQQADRALVTEERRRKVLHTILRDVRTAYWQAVTAQRLQPQVQPVLRAAREALENARAVEQQRLRPPLEILRYQKALMEIVRELEALEFELAVAKGQLAALMNLPSSQDFTVEVPDVQPVPTVQNSLDELESIALVRRPELREQAYQSRIGQLETRKALLRLLPGITLTAGRNYDSNDFVINQHWYEGGIRVAYNLLSLLSGGSAMDVAEATEQVNETRRLALSMAVMSQVNIAYRQYQHAVAQYEQADAINVVEQKIGQAISAQAQANQESELERIRSATAAIAAQLGRDRSYAEIHNATASLWALAGIDPLPQEVGSHDLPALTEALTRAAAAMETGRLPVPELPAEPPATSQAPEGPAPAGEALAGQAAEAGTPSS